MLYFHHFILHSDIRSIVIDKFSLCYFAMATFVKLSFNKFYGICNNFTHNFSMKTCYFCTVAFSLDKEQIKCFINKQNYISEVFKKF